MVAQKQEFLGGALALLLPVDWAEPFGLVMIEALACGPPVIAGHVAPSPRFSATVSTDLSQRA
jgi:glycosyltransferase involved in cell wall biosynthesis